MSSRNNELKRLIINVGLVVLLVIGIIAVYRCFNNSNSNDWKLEKHPLKVQSIKKIAELSTVSYYDEVVIDSIEFYHNMQTQVFDNIKKLADPKSWKYAIKGSAIKRRLTMIYGGQVRFGFDLKDTLFQSRISNDTLFLSLKRPQILDVSITPSNTKIFIELGDWNDHARKKMYHAAVLTLKKRTKELGFETKAKKQLESLLQKLTKSSFAIKVTYL